MNAQANIFCPFLSTFPEPRWTTSWGQGHETGELNRIWKKVHFRLLGIRHGLTTWTYCSIGLSRHPALLQPSHLCQITVSIGEAWKHCEDHVLWFLRCFQHHTPCTQGQAGAHRGGPTPHVLDPRNVPVCGTNKRTLNQILIQIFPKSLFRTNCTILVEKACNLHSIKTYKHTQNGKANYISASWRDCLTLGVSKLTIQILINIA